MKKIDWEEVKTWALVCLAGGVLIGMFLGGL